MARDDFEDADQLRIGNDGIFMLTFFSKNLKSISSPDLSSFFSLSVYETDFQFHFELQLERSRNHTFCQVM